MEEHVIKCKRSKAEMEEHVFKCEHMRRYFDMSRVSCQNLFGSEEMRNIAAFDQVGM